MRAARLARTAGALIALGLAGCGPSAPVAKAPDVAGSGSQLATCPAAKDPLNPFIVEWPGTSKVALDNASQKGLVVVSYGGCVLKVLPDCRATGSYAFHPVTSVRDRLVITNESDLYAKLPLGVASLKGELATSGQLDLDYVAIGQRETSGAPTALEGQCAGATHFVRAITVGAYGLEAGGGARVGGGASVGNTGAGAEHTSTVKRLRGSGDVARCSASGADPKECMAVLQLGLSPLPRGLVKGAPPPEPAVEASSSRGPLPWIVTGAGVVILGAGATFGGLALKSYGDADKACPTHTGCSPSALDTRSRAGTFANIANVGVPLGVVGTGVGIVLFAVGGSSPSPQARTRLPLSLDVATTPAGATAIVGGTF